MITIEQLLQDAARRLGSIDIPTPRLDAEVLLAEILGRPRLEILIDRKQPVAERDIQAFEAYLTQRLDHRPVSQILGHKEFWSLDFEVTPAVLTPRPDSETLVAAVVERAGVLKKPLQLLEIGVGSGCLIASILVECSLLTGVGVDISSDALDVARRNSERHGLSDRLTLLQSDVFDALDEDSGFDIILSNPPYIPSADISQLDPDVARYEPLTALDGGMDGLDFYRRIIKEAPLYLKTEGLLAFEIGHDQGPDVCDLFGPQWRDVEILQDLESRDRVVLARLAGN